MTDAISRENNAKNANEEKEKELLLAHGVDGYLSDRVKRLINESAALAGQYKEAKAETKNLTDFYIMVHAEVGDEKRLLQSYDHQAITSIQIEVLTHAERVVWHSYLATLCLIAAELSRKEDETTYGEYADKFNEVREQIVKDFLQLSDDHAEVWKKEKSALVALVGESVADIYIKLVDVPSHIAGLIPIKGVASRVKDLTLYLLQNAGTGQVTLKDIVTTVIFGIATDGISDKLNLK